MSSVTSSHCIDNGLRLAGRQLVYWAKYRVATDTRSMSALDVLDGAVSASPHPIPTYNATYALFSDTDPSAFANSFDAKRPNPDKKACHWEVDVQWGPHDGQTDDHTSRSDPLTRPPRYNVDAEEVQVIVEAGWNDEELPGLSRDVDTFGPIQNGAGGEPGSPVMEPRRIPVLVAIINVATLDDVIALQAEFEDRLNDDEFFGAAIKTALCRTITSSEEMSAGGVSYREVTFRIAIFDQGWSFPLVNRGYRYFEEVDSEDILVEAKVWDSSKGRNVPSAEPVNLELDGTKTPDGEIGTIIHYRTKPTADFAGMGIGE